MQDKKNENQNNSTSQSDGLPLVVGIDPSTGAKSALGFSIYDPNKNEIITLKELTFPSSDFRKRLKGLIIQIVREFKRLDEYKYRYVVFIESTVMLGKGGESLQRMIGAIMAIIGSEIRVEHVSNMQIKSFVGGTGKADKEQVATGLLKFFPNDEFLMDMIRAHRYDALDSLAVGVTGFEKFVLKANISKNNKANKKKYGK